MTKERKDFYWLNDDSISFLRSGYLEEKYLNDPIKRYEEIAISAEKILKIKGFADKFLGYLAKGFYSISSPITSNFGNNRGCSISCFGNYISDNMSDILDNSTEVGMMTKLGGGTSAYFGDLRASGSPLSMGGTSSGPVHFMSIFDTIANVVSQSSIRRGAFAAYLNADHPDFLDFLKIKSDGHYIQNLHFGACITDDFMNKLVGGDKKARRIWAEIIKKRYASGYPYLFFTDTVNNKAPKVYRDKGMKIHASNLCVTGDQRVVSNFGILTAAELHEIGESLTLFDNKSEVKSSPMKLVEKDADVYKITLENGMTHTATDYHKVVVLSERVQKKNEKQKIVTKNVEFKNLKIGDSIAVQTNKGIFGSGDNKEKAFLLGLYQADGSQHGNTIRLDLWENDFDLIEEVESCFNYLYDNHPDVGRCTKVKFLDAKSDFSTVKHKRMSSNFLGRCLGFSKGRVPQWIWESNEETLWQYIRGLFYADGTCHVSESSGNPIQLSLASIKYEFLQEIQIILANLGMQSSIRILRKGGDREFSFQKYPKIYNTQDCYRLIIGNKNDALIFNKNTGFLDRKKIKLEDREYRDNTKKFYKIEKIEYIGKEDVYCCTVDSDEHLWTCNGVITHNCSEICLSASIEESFVCNISSVNVLHWDEIQKTDAVKTLFYLLDANTTEFIEKTNKIKSMAKSNMFARKQRALGLGVLGYHSLLQSKMIPFESMEAKMLNAEIFSTIRNECDEANRELAEKYGEPYLLQGYKQRCVTTMAIAPTVSSSIILGQVSSGIEPILDNYHIKNTAKGDITIKNQFLFDLLESKGKNTQEISDSILQNGGSCQHLDFLSNQEKAVFKTFAEISQAEIVTQAAQRQKWIDQSQSLNLKIPDHANPKDVSNLLIDGWRNGIKTFYYQHNSNLAQEASRDLFRCTSCEG